MFVFNQSKKRNAVTVVLGSVVLIAILGVFVYTSAVADKRIDNLPINSDGQTYGSTMDVSSPGNYPDLIAAIATNGKEGYILKTDMERVDRANTAANPEEAVAMMNRYYYGWAKTFKEQVLLATGVAIEQELIESVLNEIGADDGIECPYEFLSEKSKAKVLALLPEGYKTDELAGTALLEAFKANDTSLPVYDLDGKTVIGEFVIQ